ncbi:MAG: hypothetical protein ABEK04_03640 [Candidatus Nanohalobium sp.]
MGEDAYIDEDLVESINAIKDLFDLSTFREASELYDRMARKSTIGDVVEAANREEDLEESELEKIKGNLASTNNQLLEEV